MYKRPALENCTLTATMDGTITALDATVGAVCSGTVATIQDVDNLTVEVTIPASSVGRLKTCLLYTSLRGLAAIENAVDLAAAQHNDAVTQLQQHVEVFTDVNDRHTCLLYTSSPQSRPWTTLPATSCGTPCRLPAWSMPCSGTMQRAFSSESAPFAVGDLCESEAVSYTHLILNQLFGVSLLVLGIYLPMLVVEPLLKIGRAHV